MTAAAPAPRAIKRLLVANRSEIAIRVFRAAAELGIQTVAIYAEEDKLSLHRFKSDEAYLVGRGEAGELKLGPLEAYLSIPEVIRVAVAAKVDAIHPGYGFLSESPEFSEACAANGILFIGPKPETMRTLGNKVAARNLAISVGVPVMPATGPLPSDEREIKRLAMGVGYPVMLKASWGGGGRGMRPIDSEEKLLDAVLGGKARGQGRVRQGRGLSRKAGAPRAPYRSADPRRHARQSRSSLRARLHDPAPQSEGDRARARALPRREDRARGSAMPRSRSARRPHYRGAGTVEFLMDVDTGEFYFIEVNPRIQVEHTVTEQVTGLDIVKAQIKIARGRAPRPSRGNRHSAAKENRAERPCPAMPHHDGKPRQQFHSRLRPHHRLSRRLRLRHPRRRRHRLFRRDRHALLRSAARESDGLGAVARPRSSRAWTAPCANIAFAASRPISPSSRRCSTIRKFRKDEYTTRFIDETPELFSTKKRRDRATKLLTYIADVTVNGHPDVKGRAKPPAGARKPEPPVFAHEAQAAPPPGSKQLLDKLGPQKFAAWMRAQKRVLITDTTMRDAHQSLLATRMRTHDLVAAANAYAMGLPQLFSLECWGGATFDVAMRFLNEDPWERLALLREKAPNILTQMLLRGANGVGYTNYPDNVVRYFIKRSADAGMDVFRIFDCLNWVENMRVAIDAVRESGKLAEGAICYTGDILDPARAKYSLKYYVGLAKEVEKAGCHVLGLKDMAGLLKPSAARMLVKALRDEVGLPVHLHTHDTSGISAASVLAAVEAGVDAVDAAMDSMSGATSQPCLGSLVEALRHTERDTGLDPEAIRRISFYWEAVRTQYAAFENEMKSGDLGGLSARDARRAVHQPQGTGAFAGSRDALA